MYRLLIVPLDGSDLAERAVPAAFTIAERADAGVLLVRAWTRPRGAGAGSMADAAGGGSREEAAAIRYLDEVAARTAAEQRGRALTVVLEGPAPGAICQHAAAVGAALIVMTAHGQTGPSHQWMGSTARGVIEHAGVPVLLHRTTGPGATGRRPPYRHVLVALDESPGADRIIPFARRLGDLGGSSYSVVRVIRPSGITPAPPANAEAPDGLAGLHEEITRAALQLHAAARQLGDGKQGGTVKSCLVMTDSHSAAILREAASRRADLIAMTTPAAAGARDGDDTLSRVFGGGEEDLLVMARA